MKIFTLGPNGSFSSRGTEDFFKLGKIENPEIVFQSNFLAIWKAVKHDPESYAIIPIENSTTSNIHENIDGIFRHADVQIVAEFFMEIHLHLIGHNSAQLKDIKTLYSHPKALEQCEGFLENFKGEVIATRSTSQAAEEFKKNNYKAVGFIGGSHLVNTRNSQIFIEDVADEKVNYTRFIVIRFGKDNTNAHKFDHAGHSKTKKATVIFETFHEAGALAKVLTMIAHMGGNLQKIESRPIPHKANNYSFWVDIDLDDTPENLVEILGKQMQSIRVVGIYDKGPTFKS